MQDAIVFDVQLRTALGPLRGRVAVDRGPMRLVELVEQAQGMADLLVRKSIEREAREGRSLSCQRGCAACCRQPVPLSIPEVFYVAERIRALPAAAQGPKLARFRAAEASLDRLGLLPVWLGDEYDDERAYESALTAMRAGIFCPLLENDACSIHAERPLRCREYNVTSPAGWCAEPEQHPVRTVPMTTPLSAPLARLAAELTGTPVRLIPLTLALQWADQHRELGARTWPGPELFEGFLRHVGNGPASESGEGNPPEG